MKKYLFPIVSLISAFALPLFSFADESDVTPAGEATVKIVWYVVLVVLFGGGLIAISKWSKKINERDAEFEKQRKLEEEQEATEEKNENASDATVSTEEGQPENTDKTE